MINLSLTTTASRLESLYYVLMSLQRQSLAADRITLNISQEPYLQDEGIPHLPSWLGEFSKLEVNYVENVGPYRKLIPTLLNADPDDLIVTADDDILYHRGWLRCLLDAVEAAPGHLVCARARTILHDPRANKARHYSAWPSVIKSANGLNLLPVGCAGVVYQGMPCADFFAAPDNYRRLAPTSDDLWYRAYTLHLGRPVACCPQCDEGNEYFTPKRGLFEANRSVRRGDLIAALKRRVGRSPVYASGENDRAWRRIRDFYLSEFGCDLWQKL